VILALGSGVISWKAVFLICAILLVLMWIAIIGSLAGNDHVRKVSDRQKNHHREL